jgi:hypothetical protein
VEHKHSNAKRTRAGTHLSVRNWQFAPKARIISSFEEGEVKVIGDEPTNTDYDPVLQRKLCREAEEESTLRR